jgi:sugar O-acyltransferase (sialic acid O-acetyltransferase NeuD family)
MKRLLIVGAGGHGRVVADAARAMALWDEIAFVDDTRPVGTRVAAWPVLGGLPDVLAGHLVGECVVAIGANRVRLKLEAAGLSLATVIHPSAVLAPEVQLGAGSMVLARAVINIDARIGAACIINTAAVIEHDCVLADAVHVSPQAALAGTVHVGEASWLGIGSVVRQGVVIGADVVVGAGAAVVKNIPDAFTVVGVPARKLEKSAC